MAMAVDGAFERSHAMRRRRLDARHDAEIDELAARERALEGALEEERWGFGRMQDVALQAGAREGASFQRISEALYDQRGHNPQAADEGLSHRCHRGGAGYLFPVL